MGGAAKAVTNVVEDAVDVVGDVFEGAVDVVKEAGSWIDDNILQPAKDDPIRTAVTIAAITYGGPLVAAQLGTTATMGSVIAAGTTAATSTLAAGGDIDDALKAGVTTAGAAYLGGQVGGEVASSTGSKAAGNIARGATTGAVGAELSGGDAAQGFLTGAITSGVSEAVEGASAAVKNATGTQGSTIQLTDTRAAPPTTTGLEMNADSTSGIGLSTTPQAFGIAQPQAAATTPTLYADYRTYGTDLGVGGGSEIGIDFSKRGETGIQYDTTGIGMTTGKAPEPAFDTVEPPPATATPGEPVESDFEKASKSLAKQTITGALLGQDVNLFGRDTGMEAYQFKNRQTDTGEDLTGTTNVALKGVLPDESELRKFSNDEGRTTLIPFKNQKPQAPIPPGYKEVAVIGKAEGGLIDRPSTTMVKYSTKPLLAPRKQVKKPNTKIAGKGLASKKKKV